MNRILSHAAWRAAFILATLATASAQQTQTLTRQEAEKLALRQSPAVGSAQFSAAAAGQVPLEYRSNYLPQFGANITGADASDGSRIAAGGLNNPIIYNRIAGGLVASQLIADFGRTGNLVASAQFHAQATNQNTDATRAQTIAQVDESYYALLRAQNVLKVAQQTVATRQLVADQVTALERSKLKSQLDVSFANVNLSDAKLMLTSAENDVKAASARFSAALGFPVTQVFALTEEAMPGPLIDDVETLVREAMQSRPELSGLRFEESSRERFVKAEHSLFYPSISTIATAGYVPGRDTDLLSKRYGAVGLNLNIPIFNGGLFGARQREAEFQAQAAKQNVANMQNEVARDVRVAYLSAQTAYERVGLTAQMLDQARQGFDLAKARYEIGLGSIVELSQAQVSETTAEIAAVSAKYDYQAARAILAFTTGTNR